MDGDERGINGVERDKNSGIGLGRKTVERDGRLMEDAAVRGGARARSRRRAGDMRGILAAGDCERRRGIPVQQLLMACDPGNSRGRREIITIEKSRKWKLESAECESRRFAVFRSDLHRSRPHPIDGSSSDEQCRISPILVLGPLPPCASSSSPFSAPKTIHLFRPHPPYRMKTPLSFSQMQE